MGGNDGADGNDLLGGLDPKNSLLLRLGTHKNAEHIKFPRDIFLGFR